MTALVSPLLLALFGGALVAQLGLLGASGTTRVRAVGRGCLRWGVVLLGLQLPAQDLLDLGPGVLLACVLTVAITFVATLRVGRLLGLPAGLTTLVATGFSVCGVAAIAAVESSVRRRDDDVAVAVALVTVFGTAMVVAVPLLGSALGLTSIQIGVWAGASIHEVAQVVAAASGAGAAALAVATAVKLTRVALLLPVAVVVGRLGDRPEAAGPRPPLVPWFLAGFLVAVLVRSSGLVGPVLGLTGAITTALLVIAMFALGLGVHRDVLRRLTGRVLLLGAASTAVAATTGLVATLVAVRTA